MSCLENFDGIVRPLFIETGTHKGDTLEKASVAFDLCISIEQNRVLAQAAMRRFIYSRNVQVYLGNSPDILPQIMKRELPTTFWLDAHYCESGDTILVGAGQCPLLEELRAIIAVDWKTPPIILIDDAYMFDESIPHPGSVYPFWTSNESQHSCYNRSDWPTVKQIEEVLGPNYKRTMRADRLGEPAYILEYKV